jgi:polysaccharide export outer membrane protein
MIQRHGSKDDTVSYYVANDPKQAVATQIMVNPGDTMIVPKAGIVYILGDVNRPGAFAMSNNQDHMTLLQALSLAGGVLHSAKQGHPRLIRETRELRMKRVEHGRYPEREAPESDLVCRRHSVVPFSWAKNLVTVGAPGIAASTSAAAIYAVP